MPNAPSWVNQYVGIPYSDRGRTMEGSDCWGLIKIVLKDQFNIFVPEHENVHYLGKRNVEDLAVYMSEYVEQVQRMEQWFQVPKEEVREGDVVLLRLMGYPIHVGIAVSPTYMLHQLEGSDSVLEEIFGLMWANRVVGVFRYAK